MTGVNMNARAVRRQPLPYRLALVGGLSLTAFHATGAQAQIDDTTVIQRPIPFDYDRGRNTSVTERARPDYDALGIRRGSFLIYPRLEVGLGATDNVFLTDAGRKSDLYGLVAPSAHVGTDWSQHEIQLNGGARLRRYFDNPRRDRDEWNVDGLGRLDVRSNFSITAQAAAAKIQEEPFTGEANSTVAALSTFRRDYAGVRGQYRGGRVRGILSYDYQDFTFSDVDFGGGVKLGQRNRDRKINRIAGQGEYALSPSLAVYTQVSYSRIDYDTLLAPGIANRDSDGGRIIAGVSLDVSNLFRGVIGVGYTRRDYKSPLYRDVSGISAEGRLEYFPTESATFTLALRRFIEDSNLGGTSAYFDNRVSLKADYELLRNMIVSASAEYGRQNYIGSNDRDNIWRLQTGAQYFASRLLSLQANVSYGHRRRDGGLGDFTISELAGTVSLILKR